MSDVRRDPYSRIYHRLADEYPHVWADDRALAGYLRMLRLADRLHPSRPPVPGDVSRKGLALLVGAGLVVIDGGTYCIKGLDKDRASRTAHARKAARGRWEEAS